MRFKSNATYSDIKMHFINDVGILRPSDDTPIMKPIGITYKGMFYPADADGKIDGLIINAGDEYIVGNEG